MSEDTLEDTVDTPQPRMPIPVGVRDYNAQRQWEDWQRQRGMWRYRASLKREVQRGAAKGSLVDRAIGDLEPGQRIADEVIVPLTERIEKAQDEAHAALADTSLCRIPVAMANLLLLPADVLAVTTVLSALSRTAPAQLQGVALDLGGKVMAEVERRAWAQAEKDAEKEPPAPGETSKPNMYALMIRRNKRVDTRVFKKWSNKAERYVKGDWDSDTRKHVGMMLLGHLIEVDAWFEVKSELQRGKTMHLFQLTDMARAWIAQRHTQNELSRPFMLPMICEPLDYEYLPEQASEPEDDSQADD